MTTQPTTRTTPTKGPYKGKRSPRKMTPSLEEAVRMVRKLNGRDKIFGMMSTNDRGDITEVGVYNGITKRYALYRSDLVDQETVTEFKEVMGMK